MISLLVDEDMPRSLAPLLRAAGMTAEDVRDSGLRGRSDDEIFGYAATHRLALLTADVGFANLIRFPLRRHFGIIVVRFPNELSAAVLNAAILEALTDLKEDDIIGNLVVIEPGRIRLRRS